MRLFFVFLLLLLGLNSFGQYKLKWTENFKLKELDKRNWNYDIGCRWYNDEQQCYTEKNHYIKKGNLHIVARNEKMQHRNYTSARITTKNKIDITYGKVEVRAKLPHGRGTWPAIWMLPTDDAYGGWPKSGEIDIMEYVGFMTDTVHASTHTDCCNHMKHTETTRRLFVPQIEKGFHTYSMEWNKDSITVAVDNKKYFAFKKTADNWSEWPFNKPFHLIINLAIGGFWGGQKGIDDSIFPQEFIIDWIKVYELDDIAEK